MVHPLPVVHILGPVIAMFGAAMLWGRRGNYASLTDLQKWGCTAAMLLGRLELFTLLVVFTPTSVIRKADHAFSRMWPELPIPKAR